MRQALQQFGISLLFAILSLFIIFGALSTALAEQGINHPPTAKPTGTNLPTSAPQIDLAAPPTVGLVPSPTNIPPSLTNTATLEPPTSCPAPSGWGSYTIQLGDTLESLATRYSTSSGTLKDNNCLISNELLPDTRLSVPPYPTATPVPCGPPSGWIKAYRVQAGDNLYRISLKYRISVPALQQANCKGYSTQIKVGEILFVPNVATSTPIVSNTPTPTETLTQTNTPIPPTDTPTAVTPAETFTPLPEETSEETPEIDSAPEPED